MTEFNPLLGKTKPKVQISLTDSSEQEDDSSKPLLRKKIIGSNDPIRYRPKSLSTISRSQYSSAEFRNSSMASMKMTQSVTSSMTSSQTSAIAKTRPQSYTETSSRKVYISETNAEKLFVKSFAITSSQSQKLSKTSSTSSVNFAPMIRPISSSEPLYIQDIPSDPFPQNLSPKREIKIEIKETTSSFSPLSSPSLKVTELSPPQKEPELNPSPVEVDGSVLTKTESTEIESDSSTVSSESSSESEAESNPSEAHTSPPVQQNLPDLLYSSIIPGQESTIEIKKENQDLGINIIGGADTLLVRYLIRKSNKFSCSQPSHFLEVNVSRHSLQASA